VEHNSQRARDALTLIVRMRPHHSVYFHRTDM
jgi:hypothetical protein